MWVFQQHEDSPETIAIYAKIVPKYFCKKKDIYDSLLLFGDPIKISRDPSVFGKYWSTATNRHTGGQQKGNM